MGRALRIIGLTWCFAVAALICAVFVATLVQHGLWDGAGRISEWLNPFNVANFLVTALALAPGLICLWAADRINARA